MTYRYLLGTGTMSKGIDEPLSGALSMLENLPIREYVDPRAGRRYGRLTKMITVAARRALADADIEDPSTIPTAVATCIGETRAALGILEQIHETRGRVLSPALIPNSVHNAAAGYLSIGLKNRAPAVTVSQGWLSAEAALATADDLLAAELFDKVLVSAGDEAEPSWADRLASLGDAASAERLRKEAFEEGAGAAVLASAPGKQPLGRIAAGVERWGRSPDEIRSILNRNGITLSSDCTIYLRLSAGGETLRPMVETAMAEHVAAVRLDREGAGTVQTGPLHRIIEAVRSGCTSELLLLGAEAEELGFVHWMP